jgi:hypothetical protein
VYVMLGFPGRLGKSAERTRNSCRPTPQRSAG